MCTAHLSVAGSQAQAATNQAPCAELSTLLREGGQRQATVLAGDVNRQASCAAGGSWPGSGASGKSVKPGDYTGAEWCGAVFEPKNGNWLFANIQSPGITFAITGPWRKGGL